MAEHDDRLRRIEERLSAIEARLGISPSAPPTAPPTPTPLPVAPRPQPSSLPRPAPSGVGISATTVLGWGGVAALVLAAAYLIRLAIDSGWLTPERQVGMAGVFGMALIVAGLLMREGYRRYGSLLPAGGIAVLFLTVYGAHLYHKLIGPMPAAVGVVVICLGALALREHYKNELYTFFAVVGSYTGPYFLHALAARPLDLVIYFAAWDLLFCGYALRAGWRSVYLLSAYLAFVVFDASWRMAEHADWVWAAGFQAAQFVIFLAATILYSVRHRAPLKEHEATLHLPPLLFFYAMEYAILGRYIPDAAPWLALASVAALWIGYLIARQRLDDDAKAGEQVVATYAAIALFHAGYIELVPDGWGAFTGLIAAAVFAVVASRASNWIRRLWPLAVAFAIVAFLGYARLAIGGQLHEVVAWRVLIPLYAAVLYAAYWILRGRDTQRLPALASLYFAHLIVMAGAVHFTDSRFVVSIVWGLLAVAALVISMTTGDRRLGRSSLLVFAAFAAKVLLFDLSGTAPLVRIGCLVVLGVTLYVGGLLYQRIDTKPS
ncbi:MAG TPA: DUF2339 domain-containing protein [bacterium]|nr:DUF2339 domain-containing protein [bacterium]